MNGRLGRGPGPQARSKDMPPVVEGRGETAIDALNDLTRRLAELQR